MSEEITTPPNFMDNIREKIKNSFVELVPDETWDAMVQQEITAFFETPVNFKVKTEKSNSWGNTSESHHYDFGDSELKPTMFRTLVWGMCVEETHKHLKSEYIQNIVGIALEKKADDAMGLTKSIIEEAIPMMVNKYFESIARNMANTLAMDIQNNINNGTWQMFPR